MTRTTLMIGVAVAVSACAPTPAPVMEPTRVAGCTIDGLADLIGQRGDTALGSAAMQRAGAKAMRWLRPDTMMTMDYRTDRLNILLNDTNVVTGFRCG